MCALGRGSWVPTALSTTFYQTFFAARWRILRNAPSKRHQSRYIRLFFEGTHSVIGFSELIGMFLAG